VHPPRHNRRRHHPHEHSSVAKTDNNVPPIPGLVVIKKQVNWQEKNAKRREKKHILKLAAELLMTFSTLGI